MGKSELVFTMTQGEHKATVKVYERPDGGLPTTDVVYII